MVVPFNKSPIMVIYLQDLQRLSGMIVMMSGLLKLIRKELKNGTRYSVEVMMTMVLLFNKQQMGDISLQDGQILLGMAMMMPG